MVTTGPSVWEDYDTLDMSRTEMSSKAQKLKMANTFYALKRETGKSEKWGDGTEGDRGRKRGRGSEAE